MHFLHKHPLLCADLFWGYGLPARFVNPTTTSPNPSKSSHHPSHSQSFPYHSKTTLTPPSDLHCLRRMLLQHLLEIPARMTGGMLCHRFRGSHHHDLSSLIAPIGSQINDPVGTADYIKVVFDQPEIPEWA